MPTYQYACTNTEGKHEFEVVQSFTDAPVSECPECGAPVRKVYGSVVPSSASRMSYATVAPGASRVSSLGSVTVSPFSAWSWPIDR